MFRAISLAFVICLAVAAADNAAHMPLLTAENSLELARARVLGGNYAAAAEPLRRAAQGLADFESLFPGPEAIRVDSLREQIVYRVARLQWDRDDLVSWINYWLTTIWQWQQKEGVHTQNWLEPWHQTGTTGTRY